MATEALVADAGAGTSGPEIGWMVGANGTVSGWYRWALGAIGLIAGFADFYQLQRVGYGNTYYAATVRSMLESWHNFFFVSFDPGGFVSVDKPPLGFWMQAASAKLFGFSGFSLLLPEALAGVASVLVLYAIVRRMFGPVPGLLAAFALAVMPVSVVTNRNNTIDSLLVLTVLLAAWAVMRAVERGSMRWLLLGAVLVGLGFNIKMLEAYLVVPALAAAYLVGAPLGWWKRLWHLAVAGVVMVALSLSWIVAVDLTPAALRPYVGSSATNSELELALGYNGIERLLGQVFRVSTNVASGAVSTAGGGPGGVSENGPVGLFRLLDAQLGGQASWLLALGLIGLLAEGWGLRTTAGRSAGALWCGWTLTQAVFFSVAGFFHTYYLSMLAPGVAALAGVGVVLLWRDYRAGGWRGWLLPAALVVTALTQGVILADYSGWNSWMTPLVVGGSLAAAAVLVWYRGESKPSHGGRLAGILAAPHVGGVAGAAAEQPGAIAVVDGGLASSGSGPIQAAAMPRRLSTPAFMGALKGRGWRVPLVAAALGVALLFVGPLTWTGVSLASEATGALPKAGPTVALSAAGGGPGGGAVGGQPGAFAGGPLGGFQPGGGLAGVPNGAPPQFAGRPGFGPGGGGPSVGGAQPSANSQLVAYLDTHQGTAKFLFGTLSSQTAAPYIIATGRPVMTLGGFSGSDPILTLDQLRALIRAGQVHYFLVSGGGLGGRGGGSTNSQLIQWIETHGTLVPASAYGGFGSGGGQLYSVAAGDA